MQSITLTAVLVILVALTGCSSPTQTPETPSPAPTPTRELSPTQEPTAATVPTATPVKSPPTGSTPVPAAKATPPTATPTTTPTPEAPMSPPPDAGPQAFIGPDTAWRDLFDTPDGPEQNCIRDALEDGGWWPWILETPVLWWVNNPGEVEVQIFKCLNRKTAQAALLYGLLEDASGKGWGPVSRKGMECLTELASATDPVGVVQGMTFESTDPQDTRIAVDFLAGAFLCAPDWLIATAETDVNDSQRECLRELILSLDAQVLGAMTTEAVYDEHDLDLVEVFWTVWGNCIYRHADAAVQDYTLPPQDVQDLVNRSEAIVIGRVTAVSEPVKELPYFTTEEDYADLPEWAVPWEEVVYFDIAIEEVLLDDGNISDNPHLQMGSGSALPALDGRYLFTLHRNPDLLSYGVSAAWMVLSLDGDEIRDLAGTAPGYTGVTDEPSLVDGVRDAAANHDFLPIGEWPLLSPASIDEDGDGESSGPDGSDDPPGSTGESEQ